MLGWRSALYRDSRDCCLDIVRAHHRVATPEGDIGLVRQVLYAEDLAELQFTDGTEHRAILSSLTVLPTPSLALVICGAHTPAAKSFVAEVKELRDRYLLERGVWLPLLALVGDGGAALTPPRWRSCEDAFKPTADAPHGGLTDATLETAGKQLGMREDHPSTEEQACAGEQRSESLERILARIAVPAFVLVDFSAHAVEQLASTTFDAASHGAVCITIGREPPADALAACRWLRSSSLPTGCSAQVASVGR